MIFFTLFPSNFPQCRMLHFRSYFFPTSCVPELQLSKHILNNVVEEHYELGLRYLLHPLGNSTNNIIKVL